MKNTNQGFQHGNVHANHPQMNKDELPVHLLRSRDHVIHFKNDIPDKKFLRYYVYGYSYDGNGMRGAYGHYYYGHILGYVMYYTSPRYM